MDEKKKTNVFLNFYKIIKFIDGENIRDIMIWGSLMFLVGIIPAIPVALNKRLIDGLNGLNGQSSSPVMVCVLICVFIGGLEIMISLLENICEVIYQKVNYRTTHKMERRFYYAMMNLPMEVFDDYKLRKEIVLAQDGLSTNGIEIMQNIISIVSSIISVVSIFAMLYMVSWKLPLAIIGSTVPTLVAVIVSKKMQYQMRQELVEESRKRDYIKSLFQSKRTVKELRIFKAFDFYINVWDKKAQKLYKEDIKAIKYENKMRVYAIMIAKFLVYVVMVWLIFLINVGEITVGSFVSLTEAIAVLSSSFGTIASDIAQLYENNKYIEAFYRIIDIVPEEKICISEEKRQAEKKIGAFESVRFSNVSFSYPSSQKNNISDICMEIEKGDKVAIIGHNGSGKTTLVNLMMGLYHSYEGKIYVNGLELSKDEYVDEYQTKLACVFQDFNRYEMSIRENVAIANVSEIDKDEKICDVLRKMKLEKLNKKDLDCMLSPFYEGGIDLSGGEWQKVALARATFRNAELILFDEPTAALDPESEIKFYNDVLDLVDNKTFVIVSHRMAVTKYCNKIFVMENGKIAESGSHDELLARRGIYYNMYRKQIETYDGRVFNMN